MINQRTVLDMLIISAIIEKNCVWKIDVHVLQMNLTGRLMPVISPTFTILHVKHSLKILKETVGTLKR